MNEYTGIIREQKDSELRLALTTAMRNSPDTEAKLQRLAQRTGLPIDAVRLNAPEVEYRDRLNSFDYEKVIKENPKLSAWLSDPANASVAHDDYENLSAAEKLFTRGVDLLGAAGQGVIGQGAGSLVSGVSTLLDVAARGIDRPVRQVFGDKVADAFWYTPPRVAGMAVDPFDILKQGGKGLKQLGDSLAPPKERQNLATDVAQGVGQLGWQIAMYLLTGGTATTLSMFAQGADIMADKTAKDKADPALRDTAIVAGSAITALTEKYGLDKILNRVPPQIRNRTLRFIADKAAAGGIEAAQEFTEGLLHDITRYVMTNRDAPILEWVDREMTAAALSAAIVRTALGVRGYRQAQQQEEFFKALGDNAKASKLRERMPDRFRALVEKYTENGPLQNVYVPADRFQQYFQSVGMDPVQVARDVGVTNYDEALATGGDLAIPMADFATVIAPTDHLQGLMEDLRLRQEDMTPREAREFEQRRKEWEADILEQVKRDVGQTQAPQFEQVRDWIMGELVGRFERTTAEAYATYFAKAITTMAQRAGVDPMTLMERYDPRVVTPMPEVLVRMPGLDTYLDPLLDRLRAGDLPKQTEAFGKSLAEFIRDAGGLQDSGETRDIDQNMERRPGQRKMVQPDGMDLDRALQMAIEAGYFYDVADPSQLTTSDLLDAIAEDLRGTPRFSPMNENAKASEELRRLQALDEYLRQLGGDVATMDNATLKALIMKGVAQDAGQQYDQPFDGQEVAQTPLGDATEVEVDGVMRSALNSDGKPIHWSVEGVRNFWRWFGDSKVVDEQGRPLVMYHGTNADFAVFDPVRSRDAGVWFTPGRGAAEMYGANIMPAFVSLRNPYEATVGQDRAEALMRAADGGHDGLIVRDTDGSISTLSVFRPEQIKSATGNRGTFDAADPNILYQGPNGTPETIEVDGEQRPTRNSNGQPIHHTEEGIRNFWRWFGDSKVVDEQGRPLVVYHGTFSDFTRFSDRRLGENTDGNASSESYAQTAYVGFWFNTKPMGGRAGYTLDMPVYLSIKRPNREMSLDWLAQGLESTKGRTYRRELMREGYDGIVLPDEEFGGQSWVAFRPEQIKSATGNRGTFNPKNQNILFQGDQREQFDNLFFQNWNSMDDKRGFIRFGNDRKFQIGLLEKADLSTFLHETGHFWLEIMGDLAADPNSSQQVKDDYAAILNWFGVKDRSEIQVKHHEMFARANEAYLMEGKAPSAELRGVFQRFKAWLTMIYRSVARLNVELSPEVRGVFDRIYATDEEIAAAKQELDAKPMFLSAAEAGMSEAEFAAYEQSVAQATERAKEELQAKLMREFHRERERWWKERRDAKRAEVASEIDAMQEYQALAALVAGRTPDGMFVKLDREDLVRRYGEPFLKRLPRGFQRVYTASGGLDADTAAEMLGYPSGDDLITALVNLRPRNELIEAETDRRMRDEYGDMLLDGTVADEAMAALHNTEREKVLRMELLALIKVERDKAKADRAAARAATDLPPVAAFRQMARGIIGQKQLRDLKPFAYLLAERKASRQAFESMAKGDYVAAQDAKQRELLNHYLYLEATAVKQEADKIVDYLRGFEKDIKRAELGKAGADYLEQVDGILERYELKRVPQIRLQKREALANWLNKMAAEGHAVAVPEELQDESRRVNYQQVSIDELRAVRDAVKNIAHLARLKNKLIRKGKLVDFERVVGELLDAADDSGLKTTGDLGTVSRKTDTLKERAAGLWRRFDAAHLKVEQIIEWLDGGKIDGPWARYFFDLADDAQTREFDLHRQVTQRIQDLSESMSKEWRSGLMDRTSVRLPGFTKPMTRYDLLSIAFNMGNAQNIQRLQDGYGWSDDNLQQVRDALTAEDWRFVQGVWDTLEALWPEMAALERRMSGLEPEKVEAQRFEAAGQTWRGGYFPLVYDPRKSNAGEKQANEAESVQSFVQQGYGRPATNRGATKKRVERLAAPVLLDFEYVLTSHLAKVIKDISHREAIVGINKILTNPHVKETLIDRLGEDRYLEMRRWTEVLVRDRSDTLHQASGLGRLMMVARTNMAIVTMGWKISTMLAQFAGFAPSMDLVKPRYLAKAMIQSMQSPVQSLALVQSKSGEMRNRMATLDRDVKDALLRMRGEGGIVADVQRTAFYLTAMADRLVTVPTWLGAYNQALAQGLSEDDAIRAGDRAVRLSQGAGGAKDLAAVQRNNELMRLLTMYYTPFSVLYSRLRDMGHKTALNGIGYLPAAAARLLVLVILPAVLGELLAGRGPDEDEDEVWWAIRKMLLYPLATVPVLRDFSGYFEAAMIKASGEGEMRYAPSYKFSPVVSAIEKVAKMPGKAADAITGAKPVDDVAWDLVESSGYIFGLPTAQVRITGEYLEDLLTGDADPQNAPELMRDLIFRREN